MQHDATQSRLYLQKGPLKGVCFAVSPQPTLARTRYSPCAAIPASKRIRVRSHAPWSRLRRYGEQFLAMAASGLDSARWGRLVKDTGPAPRINWTVVADGLASCILASSREIGSLPVRTDAMEYRWTEHTETLIPIQTPVSGRTCIQLPRRSLNRYCPACTPEQSSECDAALPPIQHWAGVIPLAGLG